VVIAETPPPLFVLVEGSLPSFAVRDRASGVGQSRGGRWIDTTAACHYSQSPWNLSAGDDAFGVFMSADILINSTVICSTTSPTLPDLDHIASWRSVLNLHSYSRWHPPRRSNGQYRVALALVVLHWTLAPLSHTLETSKCWWSVSASGSPLTRALT